MTSPNDPIKSAGIRSADIIGGGQPYRHRGPVTPAQPPRKGGSLPDFGVAVIALVVGVAAFIWGYTLGLDDGKATRTATAASRPVATVHAPEKSPPVDEIADRPGKTYAVGKELKRGTYATAGGPTCRAYLDGRMIVLYGNSAITLDRDVHLFSFTDCAPFRLVK